MSGDWLYWKPKPVRGTIASYYLASTKTRPSKTKLAPKIFRALIFSLNKAAAKAVEKTIESAVIDICTEKNLALDNRMK